MRPTPVNLRAAALWKNDYGGPQTAPLNAKGAAPDDGVYADDCYPKQLLCTTGASVTGSWSGFGCIAKPPSADRCEASRVRAIRVGTLLTSSVPVDKED